MSGIGGATREPVGDFTKKVGIFEASVIAINPTIEQYKDLLEIELKEDSKSAEYLGEKDGNITLRVDVWLKSVKTGDKFKTSFFLEDRERENKDKTKSQFINEIGLCAWAEDENDLPNWFTARDYRKAHPGEEELYGFLRTWLGKLDYKSADTQLALDWKKMMKGNVKDLKDQINGDFAVNVGALATIITKEKDGEVKTFQGIYNKAFIPAYALKNFKLIDFSKEEELDKIKVKKNNELKPHERFVLNVTGEYGCKDFYILNDMKDYDPEDNVMTTNEAHIESDSEY
jgi:hypothetical protein